jgi:hypothetical protein
MSTLTNIYNLLPLQLWLPILGGPVASYILTKLKKWLALQHEATIVALLLIVSGLGSIAVDALAHWHLTAQIVAGNGGLIGVGAIFFYHSVYKPFLQLLQDAEAQREAAAGVIGDPVSFQPVTTSALRSDTFEQPLEDTTTAPANPFSAD